MDRRGFLSGLAVFGTAAGAVGLGVATDQIRVNDYVACGYIDTDTFGVQRVDFISLNGKRIEHVVACDDVEGWVKRYVEIDAKNGPRIERLTGQVRIHWKPAA